MNSLLILILLLPVVMCGIDRPRGVPAAKASFYAPSETFKCLSDGVVIPFAYINDDYCDCVDGSDEPGTSACPMMSFYCENKGHQPLYIYSSRVNDGICDCCDGSDELEGEKIQCQNSCAELGREEREKREREMKLQEEGYQVKLTYMEQGQNIQNEKKNRLAEIEKEKEELDVLKSQFEEKKNSAEAPEKEAKEKHEKAWEELKAQKKAAKEKETALIVFDEIDSNDDQHVDLSEMIAHPEFDIDSDGTVSLDEAKEYLEELERASQDDFIDKIWPNIKEIFKSKKSSDELKGDTGESDNDKPAETTDKETPPLPKASEGSDEDEEKMPDYDEETKKLIEVAEQARNEYNDADRKVRDADSELNNIRNYLNIDFGPQFEYGSLKGQCFEMTDREYVYKLCPFEKASQKPKAGGAETSLGLWGHWEGSQDDSYSAMKYEKGQNCWNGPDRSVQVVLYCGTENTLLSASEPSRCEYKFEFTTPARCQDPSKIPKPTDIHDEL